MPSDAKFLTTSEKIDMYTPTQSATVKAEAVSPEVKPESPEVKEEITIEESPIEESSIKESPIKESSHSGLGLYLARCISDKENNINPAQSPTKPAVADVRVVVTASTATPTLVVGAAEGAPIGFGLKQHFKPNIVLGETASLVRSRLSKISGNEGGGQSFGLGQVGGRVRTTSPSSSTSQDGMTSGGEGGDATLGSPTTFKPPLHQSIMSPPYQTRPAGMIDTFLAADTKEHNIKPPLYSNSASIGDQSQLTKPLDSRQRQMTETSMNMFGMLYIKH